MKGCPMPASLSDRPGKKANVPLRDWDGVIGTDMDGRIILINEAARRLTGWSGEDAIGKPLEDVFHVIDAETRHPIEDPVRKALSSNRVAVLPGHMLLIDRQGLERNIVDSSAFIKNADGTMSGAILVFRDNTENQKVIDNMIKAEKLESIGILAGGIAHDFNNLLGGIFGYVSLARDYIASDNKAFTFLSKALNAFTRASDLTKQLLIFSKAGSPLKKTVNLGPILKEMAQFALTGSNVRCTFSIPGELRLCDIDNNQIGQVIDNIVINAKHAMPQGGELTISAENYALPSDSTVPLAAGDYVRISIKDHGVGIAREHLHKIFDPFFTTKQKGTGLGLTTCFSILQKHNGFIDVESELGKGSTFFIYLPVSKSPILSDLTDAPVELKGRGRILVMDGEEFIREITKEMLKLLGYEAVLAESGEEVLSLVKESVAEQKPFEAAILDLTITGSMGGKETACMLGAIDPHVKAIVSSGYSNDPVMVDPKAYGFFDQIKKPYLKNDLARVLHRVVNHAP
jgi:two-component system, cell cycle sensor histidine kinase and response regulator CckA